MQQLFEGDADHHTLIGTDDNLIGLLRFERMLEAQEEQKEKRLARLKELQFECCADDVEIKIDWMQHWTDDEARAYFESGGQDVPRSASGHASSP